jgi:hypothetical protein
MAWLRGPGRPLWLSRLRHAQNGKDARSRRQNAYADDRVMARMFWKRCPKGWTVAYAHSSLENVMSDGSADGQAHARMRWFRGWNGM